MDTSILIEQCGEEHHMKRLSFLIPAVAAPVTPMILLLTKDVLIVAMRALKSTLYM
jgi:hypothetical protein